MKFELLKWKGWKTELWNSVEDWVFTTEKRQQKLLGKIPVLGLVLGYLVLRL